MKQAYAVAGASADALDYDEFSGEREFDFEAALGFVRRWLDVGAT